MMPLSFHPEAVKEFHESVDYYQRCSPELGLDFALEVWAAVNNIREHPFAWPKLDDETRRCLTARFPYGIVYAVESDVAIVLAVMHLHQEPGYWKTRL